MAPSLRSFREARPKVESLKHDWDHRTRVPGLGSGKKRGPKNVSVEYQARAGLLAKLVKAGVNREEGCSAGAEGEATTLIDDIRSP